MKGSRPPTSSKDPNVRPPIPSKRGVDLAQEDKPVSESKRLGAVGSGIASMSGTAPAPAPETSTRSASSSEAPTPAVGPAGKNRVLSSASKSGRADEMLQRDYTYSARSSFRDYDPEQNSELDSPLPGPLTDGSVHSGRSMGIWGNMFRFSSGANTGEAKGRRRNPDGTWAEDSPETAARAAAALAAQLAEEERAAAEARAAEEERNRRGSQARNSMTGIASLDALLGNRRSSIRAAGGSQIASAPVVIGEGGDSSQQAPSERMNTVSTIFSDRPITQNDEYRRVVNPERYIMILVLIFWLIISPFIFRYACGSSNDLDVASEDIAWASHLDAWEWTIMMVLWISVLGGIFKLLPTVTGGPSTIDASRECRLDGVASLGCCSPFSSEDDTILLRSLLGRTCTVFHTIGSRHSIQGMYLDSILNERRIKGEANRRNVWLAWMRFLHALVDVSLLMKEEALATGKPTYSESGRPPLPTRRRPDVESRRNYRPVYVQGNVNSPGVAPPLQSARNRPTSFSDVGLLVSTNSNLSEERRDQVLSWSRDQGGGRPLSMHMTAAQALAFAAAQSRQRLLSDASGWSADGSSAPPTVNQSAHPLSQIVELEDDSEEDGPRLMTPTKVEQTVPFQSHTALPGAWHEVTDEEIDEAAFRCAHRDDQEKDILNAKQAFFAQSSGRVAPFSTKSGVSHRTKRLTTAIHGMTPSAGSVTSPGATSRRVSERFGLTDSAMGSPTAQGPVSSADFPITPSPPSRPKSAREKILGAAYLRPHNLPDLDLNMSDLLPMIHMLDAWLNEMKENEWTYNYWDAKGALEKLFFACPYVSHFKGEHMVAVHAALQALYTAFTTTVKDEPDPKRPYHLDEVTELEWVVHRENLPDWTIVWSFASRARLREMKRSDIKDPIGPDPVYQSTRIKPGAIVYRKPPEDVIPEYVPMVFFRARQSLYKVNYIEKKTNMVHLIPFCPIKTAAPAPQSTTGTMPGSETSTTRDLESGGVRKSWFADKSGKEIVLPMNELLLIEMNRGKTGALNFFNDYLRVKTVRWRRNLGMRHPVQTFIGIVDARHALVQTDVFWNDGLPYFAMLETGGGGPGKRVGSFSEYSICITVQYPQFFTNVGEDDILDNTNGAYYTLWQTLRDGAKCICSSGSNAIWDITNPSFEFCTKSRSEDLGTSHEFIPHCEAVFVCSFVAYGVAKKTEDFLEALYRWNAGPLELLWPSFLDWKIMKHHLRAGIPTIIFALACFHENPGYLYLYGAMCVMFALTALVDWCCGRRPLRAFVVSTTISTNLFIVASNFFSVTWYIIFPVRMALFGILPLGRNSQQGLFWAWVSLGISLPTGIAYDALIRMTKYCAPGGRHLNYSRLLWRGAQLYANSFLYTLLAAIGGSFSAYKAWAWDYDLSMWSSFRIADSEFDKLTQAVAKESFCSVAFLVFLYRYSMLYLNSCLAALTMPTVMTKWYSSCVFTLQFVCIIVSTFFVNRDELIRAVLVVVMCTINILMTVEVVVLLQPVASWLGFPVHVEYLFVGLGLVILAVALAQGVLSFDLVVTTLRMENWHSIETVGFPTVT